MRSANALKCLVAALFMVTVPFNALAEEGKQLSVGSLIGSYDGIMEIHMMKTLEFSYQAEIMPVENDANSVTLTAHCSKCEPYKNWKRDNCKVTEVSENVKFTCKTKGADELYVFNGDRLKMSGVGAKYVYSIIAKKNVKE